MNFVFSSCLLLLRTVQPDVSVLLKSTDFIYFNIKNILYIYDEQKLCLFFRLSSGHEHFLVVLSVKQ